LACESVRKEEPVLRGHVTGKRYSLRKLRRTAFLAVILAGFAGGPVFLEAQAAKPRHDSATQIRAQIIAREKASFAAWKRRDTAFYNDYWANDMTEFLPESRRLASKSEIMADLAVTMNRWRLDDIQMHDPHVQVYGNVAILTYTESVSGRYEGRPSRYEGRVTMVYVREGGEWKGVHYNESRIGPP
jgi:ketosteroid isomerase-like protein